MIVYLNGPSSVGKTSLVLALQSLLDEPYLHVGIDKVISFMPNKLNDWTGGPAPIGFSWKESVDPTGKATAKITTGPFAEKMVQTYRKIVLTLAEMEHRLIIDDVAFGKSAVDEWRELLRNYSVLWVGVTAPLDVLEQREKERGNRMLGSARDQFYRTHLGVTYDLEVDTSCDSPSNCAKRILEHL